MNNLGQERTDQDVMKELRMFRNLSYREVGIGMGISHSRVQQLERSNSPLSEEMKQKFLKAVDVSVEDWQMLQRSDERILQVKLECIQRIYLLSPEQLGKCALFLRKL